MLLEKLCEYSECIDLPPPMYQKTPIRWIIELDSEGKLRGFIETEGVTGRKNRGKEYLAPHIGRSSGIRAKLLADNGEYVLGVARNPGKEERVRECHKAFVEQVRDCAEATDGQAVRAVLRFLENLNADALSIPDEFNPVDTLTFSIEGIMPISLPVVQEYWACASGGQSSGDERDTPSDLMECLICGEMRPAVKRLPFKIKRIRGGQASGTALISANAPAFESYGLKASLIAPTCRECGERFSKAANHLIEGENTHLRVGPVVYILWAKEEQGFNPASFLSDPDPVEVQALIKSVFKGDRSAAELDVTPFYATAFSASGGRVVVRDWLETTVREAKENLARYFLLQHIVGTYGEEGKPFGLYTLSASTVRDANRGLLPNVPKALLHVALKGGQLPRWLLYQAVKRNIAERSVTWNRVALIKMVLLSQRPLSAEDDEMVNLNPDNSAPAYLCGRLMAVLESIQRAAIPGAGSTIINRFFRTASSAPATVFGRLVIGAQAHLGVLRKEKRGTYEALQRRLEEVMAKLRSYPKTLTLEQQGLFSLGYYHQRAANRAEAVAHIQAKKDAAEEQADE